MEAKSLGDLVAQSQFIERLVIEAGGELTPELESALAEFERDITDKASSIQFVRERIESEAEFWKKKADKYQAIAKSLSNASKRLSERLKFAMSSAGLTELKDADNRFKLIDMPPKLTILDQSFLPSEYMTETIVREPDKLKIKTELQAGKKIPGCALEEVKALRVYANKGD